jgi:adenylate cyclase
MPPEDLSRGTAPPPEDIRAALDLLLGDRRFAASQRNRQFLAFIVAETLAGRGERIKAYSIAVDVFKRPSNFDGTTDPIVRIEASRLRAALSDYYSNYPDAVKIRISLPKGGYLPQFEPTTPTTDTGAEDAPDRSGRETGQSALVEPGASVTVTGSQTAQPSSRHSSAYASAHAIQPAEQVRLSVFARIGAWFSRLSRRKAMRVPLLFVGRVEALTNDAQAMLLARMLTQSLISALGQFDGIAIAGEMQGLTDVLETEPERPVYQLASEVRIEQSAVHLWWSLTDMRAHRIFLSGNEKGPWRPASEAMVETRIAERVAATIAHRNRLIHAIVAREAEGPPQPGFPSVVRAREYTMSLDPASFRVVRNALERTVQLMPDYAEAWAYLAYMYADETRNAYDSARSEDASIVLARAAAQRALKLAPYSGLTHLAVMVAEFQAGNREGFERAADLVLQLTPSDPRALVLVGNRFWALGRHEQGSALIRRGLELAKTPGPMEGFILAFDHYDKGEYREALALLRRMPEDVYTVQGLVVACYGQLGDRVGAELQIRKLGQLRPDYGQEIRARLRRIQFEPAVANRMIEGLRKAGLVVPDDEDG